MKSKVGRHYSIDTTLQIVYKRLTKAIRELEKDHEAVPGMIKKCTKIANSFTAKLVRKMIFTMAGVLVTIFMSPKMMTTPHISLRRYLSSK